MTDNSKQGILAPGDVLNNTYVISELVASGGTGEVYSATNRVSGREIAIKILKAEFAQEAQFIDLMKREASVLHEVIHDCVVRYYDLLESDLYDGFLFIVMEFIHGESLAQYMQTRGPVDETVLLHVAKRVLQGLEAAHQKNAFHRDLSPDNVLLRDGDPEKATLIDFGIAKDVNEGAKTVVGGGFAGKYQYAAPEQMEGQADGRSDLYSLGMTLIGAYRGQSPSAGSSLMEIISAKAKKPDISDMSGPLHDLVSRLVEPNSDDRFQTASEALAFMNSGGTATASAQNMDKTVVLPRGGARPAAATASTAPKKAEGTIESLQKSLEEPKKGKGGMIAAVLGALVVLGAGGAWLSGAFSPAPTPVPIEVEPTIPAVAELPLADPYELTIERTGPSDPIALRGNLPASEDISRITGALEKQLDTFAVLADVTAAKGVPFDDWADRLVTLAVVFNQIDTWSVSASDTFVTLTAQARNQTEKSTLLNAAASVISGTALEIIDKIEVSSTDLDRASLSQQLQSLGTCGPLDLSGGTAGKIGPDDPLTVLGMLASTSDATRIKAFFNDNAPGRPLTTALSVLNPGVCAALQVLPTIPSNKLRIKYTLGSTGADVEANTYHLGENPVIDIELDAEQDGYLSVIYIDLADQVYHLLPHQARLENTLQSIGTVNGNTRTVRAAYPISEASVERLGFKVVEPLGVNLVIAAITSEPLFDDVRPRAESSAAFISAVQDKLSNTNGGSTLVTFQSLTTAQ